MIISTFNPAWWLMFAVQIALILLIYFCFRKKSYEKKKKFMTVFFIFIVLYLIVYKYYLICVSDYETSIWNELPLNLCQVAALLALPAIYSKNRTLLGFCFFIGSICSLMGLLMPVDGFHDIPLLSGNSIGYFGYHGLVFVQAVTLLTLSFYRPDYKDIPKVMILIALIALAVHGINFLLRSNICPDANYFFTYDTEGNPVLNIFRNLIPVNYVYLLPLLIPVGILFCGETWIIRKLKK